MRGQAVRWEGEDMTMELQYGGMTLEQADRLIAGLAAAGHFAGKIGNPDIADSQPRRISLLNVEEDREGEVHALVKELEPAATRLV